MAGCTVVLTMRSAGAMLPRNFDHVVLGRKEEDKVRAVGANPFRREGEVPGQEERDEDGNVRDVF